MTTPKIKFRSNPRYHADSIPVFFGSAQDSRLLYDGTNNEWTVQAKDSGGTQTDRVKVVANADITTVELYNDDPGATGIRQDIHHDSASPAASDILHHLRVYGEDDGGAKTQYGGLKFTLLDPANASEDGKATIEVMTAGTLRAIDTPVVTANDTLAVLALAQTLTNKTLTAPTITGVVGGTQASATITTLTAATIGAAAALTLSPTGDLILKNGQNFIGDTANANMTVGITINQGGSDDQALSLKSSDVTTGISVITDNVDVETDDWFTLAKARPTAGGAYFQVLHQDTAGDAVLVFDIFGGTASTTKTNQGRGLVDFYVTEHTGVNGTNAKADITADGNVYSFRARVGSADVALLLIDEDGDFFVTTVTSGAVAGTAFDDYDDAALLDLYDNARAPATAIRQDWAQWTRYNEQTLIDTGILGAPIDEGGMTNMTQLQRAEIGAIRQLNEDLMALVALVPSEMRKQLTPRVQSRLLAMEAK